MFFPITQGSIIQYFLPELEHGLVGFIKKRIINYWENDKMNRPKPSLLKLTNVFAEPLLPSSQPSAKMENDSQLRRYR